MVSLLLQRFDGAQWKLVARETGRVIAFMQTPLTTLDPEARWCEFGHAVVGANAYRLAYHGGETVRCLACQKALLVDAWRKRAA